MSYQLLVSQKKRLFKKDFFTKLTQLTLKKLSITNCYFIISLLISDDAESQQQNLLFLGIDKPTDVISLCYSEKKTLSKLLKQKNCFQLGSIIINYQQAQRQAEKHGVDFDQEIALLYIHGLLHLFHYDHRYYKEKKKMFTLQEEILNERFKKQ